MRRPFALPNFAPRLVQLRLDQTSGSLTVTKEIPLTKSDGSTFSGLHMPLRVDRRPMKLTQPVDLYGKDLKPDPAGLRCGISLHGRRWHILAWRGVWPWIFFTSVRKAN